MKPAVCPNCSSLRIENISATARSYYRCDACHHVFRMTEPAAPRHEHQPPATEAPRPESVEAPQPPVACLKCGRPARTIAVSGDPPVAQVQCDHCGFAWSRIVVGSEP